MYAVVKRDGNITKFELEKISTAIKKSFISQEREYNDDIIDFIALKVTSNFEPKIKDNKISVEDIQDSV